jgi:hypothetical protein
MKCTLQSRLEMMGQNPDARRVQSREGRAAKEAFSLQNLAKSPEQVPENWVDRA